MSGMGRQYWHVCDTDLGMIVECQLCFGKFLVPWLDASPTQTCPTCKETLYYPEGASW